MGCCEAFDVFDIAACYDGLLKLERRSNDEGIDRVGGRHMSGSEQGACTLSDGSGEIDNFYDVAIQEMVDGRVQTIAATNLGQDGRRNADQRAAFMSDPGDGTRSQSE